MNASGLDKKSILDMCMGAIKERVDYEVGGVIHNIIDPNTKATAKRKITVTLVLEPDDDRTSIRVSAVAKSSLAPTNPVTTSLYITSDPDTGEMAVVEMVPQIPGQLDVGGAEQEGPKVLKFVAQR